MVQIAIAEDNTAERRLLKNKVAGYKNYDLLFEAVDGWDLLKKLQSAKKLPHILLLDINMPYVNGLLITIYCSLKYPSIKIIGISSHTNENLVREVLSEGALGFIAKYFLYPTSIAYQSVYNREDLLAMAIKSVLANKLFIDKLVVNNPEKILFSISTKAIIANNYQHINATLVQFAILNATGLPFKNIAELMCVTEPAVKKYCRKLSAEVKVTDRYELSNYCMQNGIVKLATYFDSSMVILPAWN
ncbi:MAG: response regulator transcription factor [Pedobacter sp.]|nr:response regulator transcription factor [Chitinophagaceae bacterium]